MPLLIDSGELDELHVKALAVTGWPQLASNIVLVALRHGFAWSQGDEARHAASPAEARWAIEARYREWLESRAKTNREGGRRRDTLVLECYCPWTQPNPYGVDACVKMTDAPTRIDALAKCVLAVAEKVK